MKEANKMDNQLLSIILRDLKFYNQKRKKYLADFERSAKDKARVDMDISLMRHQDCYGKALVIAEVYLEYRCRRLS